jgi:hypothetical protein
MSTDESKNKLLIAPDVHLYGRLVVFRLHTSAVEVCEGRQTVPPS